MVMVAGTDAVGSELESEITVPPTGAADAIHTLLYVLEIPPVMVVGFV
jgi:hypothetical protein